MAYRKKLKQIYTFLHLEVEVQSLKLFCEQLKYGLHYLEGCLTLSLRVSVFLVLNEHFFMFEIISGPIYLKLLKMLFEKSSKIICT